jgi:hypothetical protein
VNDYYDVDQGATIKSKSFTGRDARNLETLIDLRDENPVFYKRIGHWEVPTIYPPVAQLLFTLPASVNGYSVVLMKLFFVLFDVAGFFLIIGLLKHFHKNPCMSVIYGWSPLVLFEISNGGHYDSIPVFFTLLSLLLFVKRRQWGGTCVLAAAALSKYFSVVLLPIVVDPFKKRYAFFFGLVILAFYAPFLLWDQAGVRGVFQGFITYNQQWAYHSSIFTLIYILLGKMYSNLTLTLLPTKIVAGWLYLIVLTVLTVIKSKNDLDVIHKCFLAIAALFIINPVADPWYFCWVVPFLCFFPYKSWYLLSGLLMLSYLNFHSDIGIVGARYGNIPLIGWITYAPFFSLLILECLWRPNFVTEKPKSRKQ